MRKLFMPLTAAFLFIACSKFSDKPKLVVFISIDQGMPVLLDKYDHLFTGGYRWLKDNGIQFIQAYHEHGYTTTGPGYFVLSSGRHPGPGGVITNQWYNRDIQKGWYCVQDTSSQVLFDGSMGRSYKYIQATTLGDWLKDFNPNSKVVSIAGKDRAAVLLGGKKADIALWYDKNGGWTSSTYYITELPQWVKSFNEDLNTPSYIDSVWNRIADEDIYLSNARPDHFNGEADWSPKEGYSPTFPIEFNEMDEKSFLGNYAYTPFGDASVLELGLKAVEKYKMGRDNNPDILFLGLSATDGIGHEFGPHSQEQLDNYLRLDENLGKFIQYLEATIGAGKVLYVATSDHGSIELPEYLLSKGVDAGRISKVKRDSLYAVVKNKIEKLIGPDKVVRYGNFFYYANSINPLEKEVATGILKTHLSKLEGIRIVITKEDMLKGGESVYQQRLRNMVHPEKSPDIYLIPKKYWTWRYPYGASHGSPYDYDAHIPLIFSQAGMKQKLKSKRVKSVDIAPTVANILGLAFPKIVDGEVLLIN